MAGESLESLPATAAGTEAACGLLPICPQAGQRLRNSY
jgi:hypothetical protein